MAWHDRHGSPTTAFPRCLPHLPEKCQWLSGSVLRCCNKNKLCLCLCHPPQPPALLSRASSQCHHHSHKHLINLNHLSTFYLYHLCSGSFFLFYTLSSLFLTTSTAPSPWQGGGWGRGLLMCWCACNDSSEKRAVGAVALLCAHPHPCLCGR